MESKRFAKFGISQKLQKYKNTRYAVVKLMALYNPCDRDNVMLVRLKSACNRSSSNTAKVIESTQLPK